MRFQHILPILFGLVFFDQSPSDKKSKVELVVQTPPLMSLGRNGMHERVNDFPLIKIGK